MLDLLHQFFGIVCGQNPDHTWSPGDLCLPLCQRCTGLYVGAAVAAALHVLLRPQPTPRWLWLNGAFLLFMVPFGFHWLPQGPALRGLTGALFGFGLVAYLALAWTPADRTRPQLAAVPRPLPNRRCLVWLTAWLLAPALVCGLGACGNRLAAVTLAALAAMGALALFSLALANAAFAVQWVFRASCSSSRS